MRKFVLILGIVVGSLFFTVVNIPSNYSTAKDHSEDTPYISNNNFDDVEEILDSKINNYSLLGYFPQLFQPSLQATYYAIYILNKIGRLSTINQTEIIEYIMSCYDSNSHRFIDDYARRYLDINISKTYYPYTSLLEINCYAILSLDILDSLHLINSQESIDFIWSCYQPTSSGFMGQPYDYWLEDYFKVATADNTYFAVLTLDLLMSNWNGYTQEKNDIINFLESLQSTNSFIWYFGGFENDKDTSLDSIDIFEPNLLSSYYCIGSLDIFGMVDIININNFHDFLSGLYDSQTDSFQMAHYIPVSNYGNIVATSLGLILSDLSSFTGIDRNSVINFILNNRNNDGIWNYSTDYLYCELMDTYQVIIALSEAGELSQLTENDKDAIASTLPEFNSYYSFFLLSNDYTSLKLLYSIINTFDIYNRTSELDYQYLYSLLEDACIYLSVSDCEGFNAGVPFDDEIRKYRSFPIEYYCSGTQEHYQYAEQSLLSHKNTFHALFSLNILEYLDEFEASHNLNDLLQSIIDTQFLETGYENYGGFLPFLSTSLGSSPYQNSKIFVDYAYYAIEIMEILCQYLGLGDITTLSFDIPALNNYIHTNIFEDTEYQYFSPGYTINPTTQIENTFFAISILQSIDSYDLDDFKIKNYCENTINYSDIKSVYYTYKISEIINEDISLNHDLIYQLIGDIYSEKHHEYFQTTDKKKIDQEIVLWIAEMVLEDLSNSSTYINIDHLESCVFLSTGNNITFTINAKYSGTYWYWIDGELVESNSFSPNGDTFVYSLDEYTDTIKDYTVKINATALDESYGETSAMFSVYSPSSTVVNILELNNYEFRTTGNNITFSIHSQYPDWYNFTINGNEISSDTYYDGQIFEFSIDGYDVDTHDVKVWAIGLDDKEGEATATFSVYSTSETKISIHSIDNYVYNTTSNFINFSISSQFPENYTIEIDGDIVEEGTYQNNISILYSIDGYDPGIHDLTIWANSSDKKETSTSVQFDVFSKSFLEIEIRHLNNYEYKSTGNYIVFYLNSSFPDSYKLFIDGSEIGAGIYHYGGEQFNYSIDGYFMGDHNISIWANSTDGKESTCESSFSVYSLSNTIVNIEELPDYEFRTTGNYVKFNISSFYPDYFVVYIDDVEVNRSDYISGKYYYQSIDGYSTGDHSILIWAIGEDLKEGSASSQFYVYSNSTTIINIYQIPSYEFQSTVNYINFSVSAFYEGIYNVSIDNILLIEDNYIVDESITCSSDGYGMGNHTVLIIAKCIDGKIAQYETIFTVYSNSTTLITINHLEGCEFMSTGNYLNFSIHSKFPDYFTLKINDTLVLTDNFSDGEYILYCLDNYTSALGNYSVSIWAIGEDNHEGSTTAEFSVYSSSVTIINIHHLEGCEFMSTGNYLNFSIQSLYPDYYTLEIDGELIATDNYSNGEYLIYSLDNYTSIIRNYSVYIWARAKDGKIATTQGEFRVFSSSDTIITIHGLKDYKFLSINNYLNFSIQSLYPDNYTLTINNTLVASGDFSNNEHILYSMDNYTSVMGTYPVSIWAIGKDMEEISIEAEFTVYSDSETVIQIDTLEDCEFLTSGNEFIFSIFSEYPESYEIFIDNSLIQTDSFTNGTPISISLDNYSQQMGFHNISIHASSLDGKNCSIHTKFLTYSTSNIEIEIIALDDYEVNSTGHELVVNISCKYSLFYTIIIDTVLVDLRNCTQGQTITISIDNYDIGNHSVLIWARSSDGKESDASGSFTVYHLENEEEEQEEEGEDEEEEEEESEEDEGGEDEEEETIPDSKFKLNLQPMFIVVGAIAGLTVIIIVESRNKIQKIISNTSLKDFLHGKLRNVRKKVKNFKKKPSLKRKDQ